MVVCLKWVAPRSLAVSMHSGRRKGAIICTMRKSGGRKGRVLRRSCEQEQRLQLLYL